MKDTIQLFRGVLVVGALCLVGCTTRDIVLPNGAGTYKSTRFGNKEVIGRIEFRGEDGSALIVDGFKSDQVQALGVVAEAAVRGAVSSMVPAARSTPTVSLADLMPRIPAGFKLVPIDDPSTPQLEVEP